MKKLAHAGARGEVFADGNRSARLDWVDALRGVAIFVVVAVHVGYGFPAIGRVFIKLVSAGRYGVDLFFVISGFVLYHTYRRLTVRSGQPKRVFLFRRWARLAPLYYLGVWAYGYLLPRMAPCGTASIRDSSLNLLFLNGWGPAPANSVVPGGWSISTEAVFALFFIAVVPWLSSARRAFWCGVITWIVTSQTQALVRAGLVMTVGEGWVERNFEYLPYLHMPTFLAGVWCWHAWNARQASGRTQHPAVRGLCLLAALALLFGRQFGFWPWNDRALFAGGACALAFHAWSAGPRPQELVSPLAYLGRLSYGVYLVHFCIIGLAQTLVVGLMPPATSSMILFAATLLLTLAASLALAGLSWKYLEHPVQVWAGKIGLRDSTQRRDDPSLPPP